MKLSRHSGPELCAVVVIGFEHSPAEIDLDPLVCSFEKIATEVLRLLLLDRVEIRIPDLVHPIHQVARLFAWEVEKTEQP